MSSIGKLNNLNNKIWWRVFLAGVVGALMMVMVLARGNAPAGRAAAMGSRPAFVPVDVMVDSGNKHLGAYQVEVVAKGAAIVGLEGGESKAFAAAPYYDPAALQGNRIIVAAFSTDADLPTGLTRVARLHLMRSDGEGGMPTMTEKLVVATDGEGNSVDAKLTLRAMQGDVR